MTDKPTIFCGVSSGIIPCEIQKYSNAGTRITPPPNPTNAPIIPEQSEKNKIIAYVMCHLPQINRAVLAQVHRKKDRAYEPVFSHLEKHHNLNYY